VLPGFCLPSGHKRFDRWAERGIWQDMLEHVTGEADMESVMIDATIVRAHSSASAKKGIKRKKPWGAAEATSSPKSTRS
jgi:transposase